MGQFIPITSISLDTSNFRHHPTITEREALRSLLAHEANHGVLDLALDIVEQEGLDPSSLLIVCEDQKNTGYYIALEGNRRITALKAMINPELAESLPSYSAFKKLSSSFLALG